MSDAQAQAASAPTDGTLTPPEAPRPARVRGRELALVALLGLLLYIPYLGSYNLWDPWETHYGEVARRMQEDHEWIRMKWQNERFGTSASFSARGCALCASSAR